MLFRVINQHHNTHPTGVRRRLQRRYVFITDRACLIAKCCVVSRPKAIICNSAQLSLLTTKADCLGGSGQWMNVIVPHTKYSTKATALRGRVCVREIDDIEAPRLRARATPRVTYPWGSAQCGPESVTGKRVEVREQIGSSDDYPHDYNMDDIPTVSVTHGRYRTMERVHQLTPRLKLSVGVSGDGDEGRALYSQGGTGVQRIGFVNTQYVTDKWGQCKLGLNPLRNKGRISLTCAPDCVTYERDKQRSVLPDGTGRDLGSNLLPDGIGQDLGSISWCPLHAHPTDRNTCSQLQSSVRIIAMYHPHVPSQDARSGRDESLNPTSTALGRTKPLSVYPRLKGGGKAAKPIAKCSHSITGFFQSDPPHPKGP